MFLQAATINTGGTRLLPGTVNVGRRRLLARPIIAIGMRRSGTFSSGKPATAVKSMMNRSKVPKSLSTIIFSAPEEINEVLRGEEIPNAYHISVEELFEAWCVEFERSYLSEEEKLFRFKIFQPCYARVIEHNCADPSPPYTKGLNDFADMTAKERSKCGGALPDRIPKHMLISLLEILVGDSDSEGEAEAEGEI